MAAADLRRIRDDVARATRLGHRSVRVHTTLLANLVDELDRRRDTDRQQTAARAYTHREVWRG